MTGPVFSLRELSTDLKNTDIHPANFRKQDFFGLTIIFYNSNTQPFFINFLKGKRSYSISDRAPVEESSFSKNQFISKVENFKVS